VRENQGEAILQDPTNSANPRLRAVSVASAGQAWEYMDGAQRVTLVPLTIRRRHNRKMLIAPAGQRSQVLSAGVDQPVVKTLGKAFYWQRLIDEGQYETATDLARALKLEPGWVAEVLRMTMLAPDIIEAFLEGRQPRHLNLQVLRGRHDQLPRDWAEQRRLLGFEG
jgi:hypothetical protein